MCFFNNACSLNRVDRDVKRTEQRAGCTVRDGVAVGKVVKGASAP